MRKSVFAAVDDNRLPVKIQFPSLKDRELKEIATKAQRSQKTLKNLDKLVRKTFNLPSERGRNLLGKVFYAIMPKRIVSMLPEFVSSLVPPEESDYIHATEELVRKYTNDVQGTIKQTRKVMGELNNVLIQMRINLGKAQTENWNARKLQEYVEELADIQTEEEVDSLLDAEFDAYLSDEERTTRRNNLLNILKTMIQAGEGQMCLLARFGNTQLQAFQKITIQLASFVAFKNAAIAMRDGAIVVTNANESAFIARDVLLVTISESTQAIEKGLETIAIMPKYFIAGTDMMEMVKGGIKQLDIGLENVRKSDQRLFAQSRKKEEAGQISASVSARPGLSEPPPIDTLAITEPSN